MSRDLEETLEEGTERRAKQRARKRRATMRVSGKSVFTLQRILSTKRKKIPRHRARRKIKS